jgi:hypothetical protein
VTEMLPETPLEPSAEKLPERGARRLEVTSLPHILAVVLAALAVIFAPPVDHGHPAGELSSFFSSVAQISVTLLVAVALFQGALTSGAAHNARRWLTKFTFVYLGVATLAGVIGSTASVDASAYRWLFGVSAGFGGAGLLTVLLMGAANIRTQQDEEIGAQATKLAQSGLDSEGSTSTPHETASPNAP